jgi:hypothetical protein
MGKASTPQAPDMIGAAKETAAGNEKNARYTTNANRINQITPYGSLTYSKTAPTFNQSGYDAAMAAYNATPQTNQSASVYQPFGSGGREGDTIRFGTPGVKQPDSLIDTGNVNKAPNRADFMGEDDGSGWTQTMNLTPQAQATLDKQMKLSDQYADAASAGFGNIKGLMENPNIDTSGMPQYSGIDLSKLASAPVNAGMTAQQAMMSRLQPTLDRNDEALRTRLANQGIGLGSQAYGREQNLAGQNANDLYLQSAAQGIGIDQAARQQGFNEQMSMAGLNASQRQAMLNEAYTKQSRPLDLINSLRTGAQVQNPTFQPYAQQANVAGPDILGATNQQYQGQVAAANAQNAASGGMMSGLGNLALTGAKMGMFSDRRMKESIVKIGSLDNGLNLYKFDYKPEFKDIAGHGTFVGVMADEAKAIPNAVIRQANGYDIVDYSKVY